MQPTLNKAKIKYNEVYTQIVLSFSQLRYHVPVAKNLNIFMSKSDSLLLNASKIKVSICCHLSLIIGETDLN